MESSFLLSCESTIDLPYSYANERNLPVLFYSYQVDGVNYEDEMNFSTKRFLTISCSRATCCTSPLAPA